MADNVHVKEVSLRTEEGRTIRGALINRCAAKRSRVPIGVDLILKSLGFSMSCHIPPPFS